MVKGGRQSTCLVGQHSREWRENIVPAGTLALVTGPELENPRLPSATRANARK
jgi:hypothetical protein